MKKIDKRIFGNYIREATEEAKKATCKRRKCGAVIGNWEGFILGRGFNSPPGNLETQRRCLIDKTIYNEKITDKTCCMHAEQRAFFDAIDKHGKDVIQNNYSILVLMAVNNDGKPIPAGEPYCTICSKSALDIGISEWILQHESGLYLYDSEEYNDLSFNFRKN